MYSSLRGRKRTRDCPAPIRPQDDPGPKILDRRALRPDFAAIARVELQKWFDADTDAQLIDGLRKAGLDIAAGAL